MLFALENCLVFHYPHLCWCNFFVQFALFINIFITLAHFYPCNPIPNLHSMITIQVLGIFFPYSPLFVHSFSHLFIQQRKCPLCAVVD